VTGVLLPQGGGTLRVTDWLDVMEADYLRSFLPSGGAAVKLAVPGSRDTAEEVSRGLRERAVHAGLAVAGVDAASTRLHMVDDVFAAVSSQLDWRAVARGWLRRAYADLGLDGADQVGVEGVAEQAELDPRELQRSLRRRLEQTLLADAALPRDLRTAVLRVAQGEAAFPEARPEESDAALAWLRGEPLPAAALRMLGISGRVTRSTARALLVSLGRVLAGSGGPGLAGLSLSSMPTGWRSRGGPRWSSARAATTPGPRSWTLGRSFASSSTRRSRWPACSSSWWSRRSWSRTRGAGSRRTPPCS
jgi:hypothetical protein